MQQTACSVNQRWSAPLVVEWCDGELTPKWCWQVRWRKKTNKQNKKKTGVKRLALLWG